jgi:ankyrin repeat protein
LFYFYQISTKKFFLIIPLAKQQCLLVETNFNFQKADKEGNTELHFACKNENLDLVKYLFEVGRADVNAKNSRGQTPLLIAMDPNFFHPKISVDSDYRLIEIVEYLICEQEADPDEKDDENRTCIEFIFKFSFDSMKNFILFNLLFLKLKTKNSNETLMKWVKEVYEKRCTSREALALQKIHINSTNILFSAACIFESLEIAKFVFEQELNFLESNKEMKESGKDHHDKDGSEKKMFLKFFYIAIQMDQQEIIKFLIFKLNGNKIEISIEEILRSRLVEGRSFQDLKKIVSLKSLQLLMEGGLTCENFVNCLILFYSEFECEASDDELNNFVKSAIEKMSIDINSTDSRGKTLLHFASVLGALTNKFSALNTNH